MDPPIDPNEPQAQHTASSPYGGGAYNLVGVPPFSAPGPPVYTQLPVIPVGQDPQLRAQRYPSNHPIQNGGYGAPTTPWSYSQGTNDFVSVYPPWAPGYTQPQYDPQLRAPYHPGDDLNQNCANSAYTSSSFHGPVTDNFGSIIPFPAAGPPVHTQPTYHQLQTPSHPGGCVGQNCANGASQSATVPARQTRGPPRAHPFPPLVAPSADLSTSQVDRHFFRPSQELGSFTGQAPNQFLSQLPLAAPKVERPPSRRGPQHRYDRPGSEWETAYIHREIGKALAAKRSIGSVTPRIALVLSTNLRREADKKGEKAIKLTQQSVYNKFKRDDMNPRELTEDEERVVKDLEKEVDQALAEQI